MCLKSLWKDLFKTIRTCKLKSQLLVCYITSISLVMLGLIFVLYISLNILDTYTIDQIESTLNDLATKNNRDFVSEFAKGIHNQLMNTVMISAYLNYFVLNLQNVTASPFLRPSITLYGNLPSDCTVQLPSYDYNFVCLNYSSYACIDSCPTQSEFFSSLGYLAYIFPEVFALMSPLVHRILIWVPDESRLITFPGENIPSNYNVSTNPWASANITGQTFKFISLYTNQLNSNWPVVSLVQQMNVTNDSSKIALINTEIQGNSLYNLLEINGTDLNDNETKAIIGNDGTIINCTFFGDFTTVSEFNNELWDGITELKYNTSLFILHENYFYRINFQSIPINAESIEDVWLFVLIIVKEKTIMKYRNESQKNLEEPSQILLGLTGGIALIIILVSAIIVDLTGKSIAKPLVGIKTLTDRIYAGEKNIEKELDLLEEGTEQVTDLVRAFKSLVNTVSYRRHAEVSNKGKRKIYPPNELYQSDRVTWKDQLSKIPN